MAMPINNALLTLNRLSRERTNRVPVGAGILTPDESYHSGELYEGFRPVVGYSGLGDFDFDSTFKKYGPYLGYTAAAVFLYKTLFAPRMPGRQGLFGMSTKRRRRSRGLNDLGKLSPDFPMLLTLGLVGLGGYLVYRASKG